MSRLKLVIFLGFVTMFIAGLAIGRSHQPSLTVQPTKSEHDFPNFRTELGLSDAQEQQMRKIWKDARARTETMSHQFHEFDRQRDESVLAILTTEQRAKYDEIQQDRDTKVSALRADIAKIMQQADSDTRTLLTKEQVAKFDELIKQHSHRHGTQQPWLGSSHRHNHAGPDSGPSTAPATPPGI